MDPARQPLRLLGRLALGLLALALSVSCVKEAVPQCKEKADCQQGKSCVEGVCACAAPSRFCGDTCVDIRSDNGHCGACDEACSGDKQCRQGRCQCPAGQRECPGAQGACIDTQTHAKHCGGCGSACGPGQFCSLGQCVNKCPDRTPDICSGGCVQLNTDNKHCGKCDNACESGKYCYRGSCQCPAGLRECGGKCIDPLSDRLHCGDCDTACPTNELCAGGQCLKECPKGTPTICFGGCVDTQNNNEHCGGCGNVCQGGKRCVQGVCTCVQDKLDCLGVCVNPRYTRAHCGRCSNACGDGKVCGDGRCLASCPRQTQSVCFGGCVDLKTNTDHCGKCGTACLYGQVCTDGKCECPKGQQLCDGQCVDTQSNPQHCGKCKSPCEKGKVCGQGKCLDSCPKATPDVCARACVNHQDNNLHCGVCGRACAPGKKCDKGTCGCDAGLLDCKGQCVDVQSSQLNCGTCNNACPPGSECDKGKCKLVCLPDQGECSNACVDLQSDKLNCGACGNACKGRKICDKGKCECPGQLEDCNGACLDLNTNASHCGSCSNPCNAGERCTAGACKLACLAGQQACSGQCVKLDNDTRHCGKCGNKCLAGQICNSGSCECPKGQKLCAGACVFTDFDTDHCGDCSQPCKSGEYCISGACKQCTGNTTKCGSGCCPSNLTCCNDKCVLPTTNPDFCGQAGTCGVACKAGESCCGGTCTDLLSNAQSCGACGKACKSGESCCAGSCVADLQNNDKHCGGCGKACKATESCCNGTCVSTQNNDKACGSCTTKCSANATCCGSTCADTQTSTQHCGGCNKPCAANETCCNGTCTKTQNNVNACGSCTTTCATGQDCCGNTCRSVQSDLNNCGACGTKCTGGAQCCGGSCKNLQSDPTACGTCTNKCLPGSSCCSGVCADFTRDRINCGRCGNRCTGNDICFKSTCRCVPYYYDTCGNNKDDDCDGIVDNPEVCAGTRSPTSSYYDHTINPDGSFQMLVNVNGAVEIECYNADASVKKAKFTVATFNTSTHYVQNRGMFTHANAKAFALVWSLRERSGQRRYTLYVRLYDDKCNALSGALLYQTTPGNTSQFHAAMSGAGVLAVVYRSSSINPVIKFYNKSGTVLKTMDVDTTSARKCSGNNSAMRVAMNTSGIGVLTCQSSYTVPIRFRRFNASRNFIGTGWTDVADSANGNSASNQGHNLGINDKGQFAIQWQNYLKGQNYASFFSSAGVKTAGLAFSKLVGTATNGFYNLSEPMPVLGDDFVLRDTPNDNRRIKRWYRYSPTGALRASAAREYNFDPRYTRANGVDVYAVNYIGRPLFQKLDLAPGKGLCGGKACLCKPNSTILCSNYSFGSQLRNQCHYGTRKCAADGLSYGTCTDFGLPIAEVCGNRQDDDCNGRVDDNCNVPNTQVFPARPTDYDVSKNGVKMWAQVSGYTLLGYCMRNDGAPVRQPWVISTQSFPRNVILHAAKGSGRFYLAWIDQKEGGYTDWSWVMQIYDDKCKEVGSRITLYKFTLSNAYYANIAVDDSGKFAFAYFNENREVMLQFYTNAGAKRGAAIKLDNGTKCRYPLRVAMNPTTGAGVFVCHGSNTQPVYYQRFKADGTMQDAQLVLVQGSDNNRSTYSTAVLTGMNTKGQFVVVWTNLAGKSFHANFYAANTTGTPVKSIAYSTNGRYFTSAYNYIERVALLGDDFILRDGEFANTPTFYRYSPTGVLKGKATMSTTSWNRAHFRTDGVSKHYISNNTLLMLDPFTFK